MTRIDRALARDCNEAGRLSASRPDAMNTRTRHLQTAHSFSRLCLAACVLSLSVLTAGAASEPVKPVSREMLLAVLQGSDWRERDVSVMADDVKSPSCSMWLARNGWIPGAGVIRFALTAEGKLLGSTGDMTGLTRVLRDCVSEDAVAWAKLVAAYVDATSPKVILESDVTDVTLLKAAGHSQPTPTLRAEGDGSGLRFVMRRGDGRVLAVQALVPKQGPVQVTQTPVERL